MTNAYDYDPDARYEDDETGSATVSYTHLRAHET